MLQSVKRLMDDKTSLLVSVPNAFSATNFWNMLKGIEFVHPDHNYYFSYVTFNNILKKSGLEIIESFVYSFSERTFKSQYSAIKIIYWDLMKKYKSTSGGLSLVKIIYLDVLSWSNNFVENQLVRFLYARSGFFGDGLLAICQLRTNIK